MPINQKLTATDCHNILIGRQLLPINYPNNMLMSEQILATECHNILINQLIPTLDIHNILVN